uniref:TIL domain-containing protein n=1 Tax=Anopheles dirus TaxID=7168 RepID=A0A182N7E8_9DIPT
MNFTCVVLSVLLVTLFAGRSRCQEGGTDPQDPISCLNPNEEPLDCGPACGDRTCRNQRLNNVVCTKQCVPGCYCIGGYVRNSRNICIPSYMCSTVG